MYFDDAIICGWPCSNWISLMEETYSINMSGYNFNGWPNGKPLMEQEQCVVDILKIVLAEWIKVLADGAKE